MKGLAQDDTAGAVWGTRCEPGPLPTSSTRASEHSMRDCRGPGRPVAPPWALGRQIQASSRSLPIREISGPGAPPGRATAETDVWMVGEGQ